jgi:hypothetical protein
MSSRVLGASRLRNRSGPVAVGVMAVGLVGLADWLFYQQPIGFTVGGFGLAILLALLIAHPRIDRSGGWARLTVALTSGLLTSMVIEPNALAIALAGLGLVTLATLARHPWASPLSVWVWRWGMFGPALIVRLVWDLGRLNAYQRQRIFRRRYGPDGQAPRFYLLVSLIRWVAPVALTLVFAGLLISANPLLQRWGVEFSQWMKDALERMPEIVTFGRVVLWAVVLMVVWTLLRMRVRDRQPVALLTKPALWLADFLLEPGTLARCLAVFNAIFAVQTVLDVRYLWYGAALPAGLTYAEYAHRGAYPLMATAIIAGLMVLVTFRQGGAAERSRWARWLVYLWIVQNLLLLTSAALRLGMYVDVYGLSRWRVAAAVWMLIVAGGFVAILLRLMLRRSHAWLTGACVWFAVVVLSVTAVINVDGIIADHNVRYCRELTGAGVELDVAYLEHLGYEALPALQWAAEHLPKDAAARGRIAVAREGLEADLMETLSNWRGWTLRRVQLANLLIGSEGR